MTYRQAVFDSLSVLAAVSSETGCVSGCESPNFIFRCELDRLFL